MRGGNMKKVVSTATQPPANCAQRTYTLHGLLVSSSVAATKQPEKNIATQSDSRWMSSLLMSTFCVLCVECTRAYISTIHITHVIYRTLQTYIQCYLCVCVLYSVHPREFISAVILAEILCLVLVCSFCVLLVN